MQHVKWLTSFVTVAEHASIREAAERLHLSSSALNRQILDLEGELGTPLFERHARGVRLSAAGEAYLVYAKRALREAEAVHAHIDALKGLRRGHVGIAAVAAIADERLMALIVEFQRTHAQVGITLTVLGAEQVVEAVVQNDADLGLTFNTPGQSDFHVLASTPYSIHAIVTEDHPLAAQDRVSIAALHAYPLGLGDRSWGGRRLLDEYLHASGMRLEPQIVSNAFEVLAQFVRLSSGVCLQIRAGARREAIGGGLVALPVTELQKYARVMTLGSLRGRTLPSAAARFAECVQTACFPSEQS
ncbi:LysR family transcriptional regulator [Pararobbsia silviterrae]|uniref:LysR family transcriptional regulator n=1 Tax=Pararobbsia silviterrae TaxID=1792498 RepID=A0A494XV28_9BURK|nr:LysR family transcriptional regulator [Pararobbsia silviterrae]RKP51954.1 LysR family transcriptional regulator [Pararobbsia silviterrae]